MRDRDKVALFLQRRGRLEIGELILSELDKNKYIEDKNLLIASHYSQQEVKNCVASLRDEGKLIVAGSWVVDLTYWQKQTEQLLRLLTEKHSLQPLEKGSPQGELQSRLKLPKELFDQLIASLTGSPRAKYRGSRHTQALAFPGTGKIDFADTQGF